MIHKAKKKRLIAILSAVLLLLTVFPVQNAFALTIFEMGVQGTVTDDKGDPLSGYAIMYAFQRNSDGYKTGGNSSWINVYSDSEGEFSFTTNINGYELDEWMLYVRAEKLGLLADTVVAIQPGVTVTVPLSIDTHETFTVHITDPSGSPAPAGVPYWFTYVSPSGSGWPNSAPLDGVSAEKYTNSGGTISFEATGSGTAYPAGTPSNGIGPLWQSGDLRYERYSGDPTGLTAHTPRSTDEKTIKVRPLGKIVATARDSVTGDVVTPASFTVSPPPPYPSNPSSENPNFSKYMAYDDGVMSIYGFGDLTVNASASSDPRTGFLGYKSGSAAETFTPWGTDYVDVPMVRQSYGTIDGTVLNMSEQRVPGAQVELIYHEWAEGFTGTMSIGVATADENGDYSFDDVIPSDIGWYIVRAIKNDYIGVEDDIEVDSGDTTTVNVWLDEMITGVCQIGMTYYDSLDEALEVADNGETITLLKDITDNNGMVIDSGKSFTIDLNGHTLSVSNSGDMAKGLEVTNGSAVSLDHSSGGAFNVFGSVYGVYADGGTVTVSNASAGDATFGGGVAIYAINGANVTATGNAEGTNGGIAAMYSSAANIVTVNGDVKSTGDGIVAVSSQSNKNTIHVLGNVIASGGSSSHGILGAGHITVDGNVEGNQIGAEVSGNFNVINIGGNVTARGTDNEGAGFFCYGALTSEGEMFIDGNISAVSGTGIRSTGGGELTLEGTITAAHYIEFGFGLNKTIKTKADKEATTSKTGYDTYTDGNGEVWVKAEQAPAGVCQIGTTQYPTLDEALAAITDNTPTTIKLLQDIAYTGGLVINNKKITFDLNTKTLALNNNAVLGWGLDAENGSVIDITNAGIFNVTGNRGGLYAYNSSVKVTNATGSNGQGVWAGGNSIVTVTNDATSVNNIGVEADSGSKVSIGGNVSGGIYADGPGSQITLAGSVTSAGTGAGADARGGAIVAVDGNVTGVYQGVFSQNTNSSVTVKGNVTATGATGIGVYSSQGGSATIDGTITAPTYIKTGSTTKTAADKEPVTTKTEYLTYSDGTSTVWVKDTSIAPTITGMTLDKTSLPQAGGTVTATVTGTNLDAAGTVLQVSLDGGTTKIGTVISNTGTNVVIEFDIPENTTATEQTYTVTLCLNGTATGYSDEVICDTENHLDNWIERTSTNVNYTNLGVTYGNGKFVTVGSGARILTSTDGAVWTSQDSGISPTSHDLYCIAYGSNTFVAVGFGGTVLTSPDGETWTKQSSDNDPVLGSLYSVCYGNGTFVAVGISGRIWTSPDGAAWTRRDLKYFPSGLPYTLNTDDLLGVAYGNGSFVAVGYQGTVMTSADGVDWTVRSANYSEVTDHLEKVAFGASTFVAVGDFGRIWTSPDGAAWTKQNSGAIYDFDGVTYSNSTFVAVGAHGMIVTSLNGSTWTSRTSGISSELYDVTYGTGSFVAVGANNVILQSGTASSLTVSSMTLDKTSLPQAGGTVTATVTGTNLDAAGTVLQVSLDGGTTKIGTVISNTGANAVIEFDIPENTTAAEQTYTITLCLNGTATGHSATVSVAAAVSGYVVTFDAQGGSSVSSISGITSGNTINAPAAPIRSGYTFGGWYKESSCTNAWNFSTDTVTGNITLYAKWTHNNGGGGGGSSTNQPTYSADLSGLGSATTLAVTVNEGTNNATVGLSAEQGGSIAGGKNAIITVPSISGIDSYTLNVPASLLSASQGEGTLTLATNLGSIVVPDNMLVGMSGTEGKTAGITIGQGDKSDLSEEARAAIGDRPLIQLTLTLDGKQTDWNNPDAPVTVSIPYTPTAEELANPENIVIWYVDGSGNLVSVPNGHYDPATGTVTFTATHFSDYAVGYHQVRFGDVPSGAWYAKPVNFIAARGITTGTGGGKFAPDAKLTRGEFIVMMMKAYSIEPDTNPESNFSDAGSTYYTGYLAAAKRLGISSGIGGNMFVPAKEITRQEMFTLLYNALKVIDRMPEGTSERSLSSFSDAGQIASWAKDAMSLFIEAGIIGGSNGRLSPTATTTRAEMAQVLYNLLAE